MTQKCIICGRIIGNYGIYCPKCQEDLEKKLKKRDRFEEVYKSADFFERQRLRDVKEALKERQAKQGPTTSKKTTVSKK
jgi:hypothetical protein